MDSPPAFDPAVPSAFVRRGQERLQLISTDPRQRLTVSVPHPARVLWSYHIQSGYPITGPAVTAGSVCVGSASTIVALDTITGIERWRFEMHSPVRRMATVDDAFVVESADPATGTSVYLLDAASGDMRWVAEVSFGMSLASVDEATVYLDGTGMLYAIESGTGRERWQVAYPGVLLAEPTAASGLLYVLTGSATEGWMIAFNAATGTARWWWPIPGRADAKMQHSIDGVSTLFVIDGSGDLHALNAWTGAEWWSVAGLRLETPIVVAGSLVCAGLPLHAGGGNVCAMLVRDATTQWQFRRPGHLLPFWGSEELVLVIEHELPAVETSWVLYSLDAQTGTSRWRYAPGVGFAPPVVVDKTVYVATDDEVSALDARTGRIRWQCRLDAPAGAAAPIVARHVRRVTVEGGCAYVETGDRIYAVSNFAYRE